MLSLSMQSTSAVIYSRQTTFEVDVDKTNLQRFVSISYLAWPCHNTKETLLRNCCSGDFVVVVVFQKVWRCSTVQERSKIFVFKNLPIYIIDIIYNPLPVVRVLTLSINIQSTLPSAVGLSVHFLPRKGSCVWITLLSLYSAGGEGGGVFLFCFLPFDYEDSVGRTQQIIPSLRFCCCCLYNGDQLAHTNSILKARISPRWLSELRRLCTSVLWRVACELVFPWEVPTHYGWTQ